MPRRSKVTLKKTSNKADLFLISLAIGLSVFGLIMVLNASAVEAYRDFGDKLYYFKLQLQWLGLGLLGFLLALKFDHRKLKTLAFPLIVVTFISLIAVLIPGLGVEALGAKRWLRLGPLSFQPAELAKFSFVLYLAAFLAKKKNLTPFLVVLGLLVGLIMLEPDLGTAVIVVVAGLTVYFVSGAPLLWMIGISGLGLLAASAFIFFSPYRKDRLLTFLNPTRDPLGKSYHIQQILIALGSGGLFGLGLGQSRQKYEYLPMVTTDSIFAIIAEEAGFIGSALVLLAFLLFIWQGFKVAKAAPEGFSQLLAAGITAWIGLQALINLAAMVALVPLTGVPLPFISYGGSSLVLVLFGSGILANISKFGVVKK